jgi:hypothetical protein
MLALCDRCEDAPSLRCRCGLYAFWAGPFVEDLRVGYPQWPEQLSTPVRIDMLRASVMGRVMGWGRLIEHRKGWRAASAYPESLAVICAGCCVLDGRLTPADWICSSSTHPAIAACEHHTRQYREVCSSMQILAAAADVEAEMLERYGVERAAPPTMSNWK